MIHFLKKRSLLANAYHLKNGAGPGFTFIEVLMVIAIMSISFATIYKSFAQLNRSYTSENVKAGVQQGVRFALEFMVQDIRLAGLDPLGTANAGVAAGVPLPTSSRIEFTSDINFDGEIVDTDDFERIEYKLDGTKLVQTIMQTTGLVQATLLDNVTNLSFTFLDVDDQTTTTTTNDEIRSVMISLTVEKPAGRAEPVTRTYATTVRCRNL